MEGCLAQTLIYRAVGETDTFYVKSRKFLSVAYFLSFVGVFLPCLWIYVLLSDTAGVMEPEGGRRGSGLVVTAVSWGLYFLLVPLEQWIYMHYTKDYPGWLSGYVSHFTMVHLCVVYFNYEGFPVAIHVALVTTVAVARPPFKWFSVLATVCVLAVDAVNLNFGNILRVPGYHRPGPLEASIMSAFGYFCAGLGVLIAWLSSSEAARNVEAMRELDRFVRAVVPGVASYDLELLNREIAIYRDSGGGDSSISAAFEEISSNLLKYRPFLPNYLFMKEELLEDVSSRLELSQDEASLRSCSSPNSQADSGTFPGSPARVPSGVRIVDSRATKRIAMGALLFSAVDHEELLEKVFLEAPRYGAAVHSFIGDELVVTWNATARVPGFEMKACGFVCRFSGVRGYVLSCEAEVGTYGQTSKLFSASIGARGRVARGYMSGVSRGAEGVLVNYAVYENACATMDFEGHSYCDEEEVGPIFVLVGEVSDAGEEEWLYSAGRAVPESCMLLLQRRTAALHRAPTK